MEGIAGDQSSTAPDEDLLAFVLRATETVRAALGRPVKTKAKINMKRYVQKQLHKYHDCCRYRVPRKRQKRISTSPMGDSSETSYSSMASTHSPTAFPIADAGYPDDQYLCLRTVSGNVMPLQYSGNSKGAQCSNSYASQSGYALQTDDAGSVSATQDIWGIEASQDAQYGYSASVSDEFLCGKISFCSEAGPEDMAPGASVDPVFPSENYDQIVPFIENELQVYACAEANTPGPEIASNISESASPSLCTYEPGDCAYASFVETFVLPQNGSSSRGSSCSVTPEFSSLY
ncbi:hypothetical protein HPB50_025109 [Hyalomma asiaticum]|uniref:Uncharacterized protein n=1 Tax=Hyalomma asiaticum TaxID=266040 RepID=A0ACB7SQV3_HYAAI|nr:hypothetical protein HPB50_025109 [Hyalomma asiaticum]